MAYTYNATFQLGGSQTGLSLKAALVDAATNEIDVTHRDITSGFGEIGGGIYSWLYTSMPTSYRGSVVYYVGTLGGGATDFSGVTLKTATVVSTQETENVLGTDGLPSEAVSTAAANAIADAMLDRSNGIETGLTPRGCFRLCSAALVGKMSGVATTTVTIRNAVADSKDRIVATVDADNNRTAITTDVS